MSQCINIKAKNYLLRRSDDPTIMWKW